MSVPVSSNLSMLLGLNGEGLNEGSVYVGTPNTDPTTNPIPVFWDAGLTIPASQPLSVVGGYFYYLGSPAQPYTAGAFSITVKDKRGVQVLTRPYVRPNPITNVMDFGAYGDGTHDDTTAIQAALTAAGDNGTVYFPPGTYLLSATLNGHTNQNIQGSGGNSTVLRRYSDYGDTLTFANMGAGTITGIWFYHGTLPASTGTPLDHKVVSATSHVNITNGQDWTIRDCWFWRMPYGVSVQQSARFNIENSTFLGVWDPQTVADQEGVANVFIGRGGYCQIGKISGCYFGGVPSPTRNTTWTASDGSLTVSASNSCGSQFGISISQCEVLEITDNYMGGQSTNSIAAFLASGAVAAEWHITDNDFDGAGLHSPIISVTSTFNGSILNGLVISDNTFNGEQQAFQCIAFINSSGGTQAAVTNFTISGNTAQAMVGACVMLYNARGGVISGNSWSAYNSRNVSPGSDVTFCAAVWGSANTTEVLCSDNIVGGTINGDSAPSFCYQGITGTGLFEKNTLWNGVGTAGAQLGKVDKKILGGGTANVSLTGVEDVLLMSNTAPRQVFPPANSPPGYTITIKDAAGNAAAQTTTFIATVDGAVNPVFNVNYFVRTLLWTGATWLIIGN